jgi:hypothetical protein
VKNDGYRLQIRSFAGHLSFRIFLDDAGEIDQTMEQRLFEASCDDALLCQRRGAVFLDFDREAESLAQAVESAISDISNAGYYV